MQRSTPTPWTCLLALAGLACAEPATPAFVVVEVQPTVGPLLRLDLGTPLTVGSSRFDACELEDAIPGDTVVTVADADTTSGDYDDLYEAILRHWKYGSHEGEWYTGNYCIDWPSSTVVSPHVCSDGIDTSYMMEPSLHDHVCDPDWVSCVSAMDYHQRNTPGADFFTWSIDSLSQPPWADSLDGCACGASFEAVKETDQRLEWSYAEWYREDDAVLIIENTANTWRPNTNETTPDRNAGICGVWTFREEGWAALNQRTSEDQPTAVEQVCGGVGVPAWVYAEDIAEQAMSTIWIEGAYVDAAYAAQIGAEDYYWNAGGRGDLTGAIAIVGPDHPSRSCPTCTETRNDKYNCTLASGRAAYSFRDSFRSRLGGGNLHVLVAECPPAGMAEDSGWQRACWHAELTPESYAYGSQISLNIGGITPAVTREREGQ